MPDAPPVTSAILPRHVICCVSLQARSIRDGFRAAGSPASARQPCTFRDLRDSFGARATMTHRLREVQRWLEWTVGSDAGHQRLPLQFFERRHEETRRLLA